MAHLFYIESPRGKHENSSYLKLVGRSLWYLVCCIILLTCTNIAQILTLGVQKWSHSGDHLISCWTNKHKNTTPPNKKNNNKNQTNKKTKNKQTKKTTKTNKQKNKQKKKKQKKKTTTTTKKKKKNNNKNLKTILVRKKKALAFDIWFKALFNGPLYVNTPV